MRPRRDDDEIQPVQPHTAAFAEMYLSDGEEAVIAGEGAPIYQLFSKFLITQAVIPSLLCWCQDHFDQESVWADPDAVVAGTFWLKMPNVILCGPECAQRFSDAMREEMNRVGRCDVCNELRELTEHETLIPFSNVLILAHTCHACLEPSPQSQAQNN